MILEICLVLANFHKESIQRCNELGISLMSTFVLVLSRTSIRISFKLQGSKIRIRDPIDSSSVFCFYDLSKNFIQNYVGEN